GATRTFTVADGTTSAPDDLTVSAVISGTTAGLTKAGAGTMTLSSTNTYDGTTTVSAGVLKSGAADVLPDNAGVVQSTGTRNLNGNSDTIGSLTLESGTASGASVTTGAGTLTLGGNVTVNATGTGATAASIAGKLDLGGATRTFTVADGTTSAPDDLTVSAVISGTTA